MAENDGLQGAARLASVSYSFTSEGSAAHWRVVAMHCREVLSDLYHCTLDLATDDLQADPVAMRGRTCTFVMERNAAPRRLVGIVYRVENRGPAANNLIARVDIGPAVRALSQVVDSRIFQSSTVPKIVKDVLGKGLKPYKRKVKLDLHRAHYPVREYCVQYQETDLHFAMRLMQEEGITFYFDHEGDEEVMVLVDGNDAFPKPPLNAAGVPVPVVGLEWEVTPVESIRSLAWRNELQSTSVVLRDFDWTRPEWDLTRPDHGQDALGVEREVYEYPARLAIGEYNSGHQKYTTEDGKDQAQLRREIHTGREEEAAGLGIVTGFMPGRAFELADGARSGRFLITAVEHIGHAPEELVHGLENLIQAPEQYRNTFQLIPARVPFRPERKLAPPRLYGAQTAIVVGPGNDEIFTDEHGRIKVQFHWDRHGTRNEHSSCFVRVAQLWAGAGWGTVFLPRVGMEVVVQFLEGNPDRPLVTGCVYNGQHPPPYSLPDDKTKSTIKSSSSPGDNGFNEITLEDRAGSEKIYVHAQKDYEEQVLHDHSTTVGNDQKNHVKCNQTENVDAAQTLTVGGNRTKIVHHTETSTIDQNQKLTVKQNRDKTVMVNETETIGANQTSTVVANRTQTVGVTDTTTVTGHQSVTVGGGRDKTVTGIESNKVIGGRVSTEIGFDTNTVIGAAATEVLGLYNLSALVSVTILALPSAISMLPGRIDIVAPAKLSLTSGTSKIEMSPGKLTLSSGAGATIELSGTDVKITGTNVEVNGSAKTDVKSAGAVTVEGMLTTVKGSPVKVNC